jgi:transposase
MGWTGCAHFVSRTLRHLGQPPRIIPALYVKSFVRGQKNDYNDAIAPADQSVVRWRAEGSQKPVVAPARAVNLVKTS